VFIGSDTRRLQSGLLNFIESDDRGGLLTFGRENADDNADMLESPGPTTHNINQESEL
jgi:hypothetical protein